MLCSFLRGLVNCRHIFFSWDGGTTSYFPVKLLCIHKRVLTIFCKYHRRPLFILTTTKMGFRCLLRSWCTFSSAAVMFLLKLVCCVLCTNVIDLLYPEGTTSTSRSHSLSAVFVPEQMFTIFICCCKNGILSWLHSSRFSFHV